MCEMNQIQRPMEEKEMRQTVAPHSLHPDSGPATAPCGDGYGARRGKAAAHGYLPHKRALAATQGVLEGFRVVWAQ